MLLLAYSLGAVLSGKLLRFANLFNTVGLLAISPVLILRVVERLSHPVEIFGCPNHCWLDRSGSQLGVSLA